MWKMEFRSDRYALGTIRCAFVMAFREKLSRMNLTRTDGVIQELLFLSVTYEAKLSQRVQFLFVRRAFGIDRQVFSIPFWASYNEVVPIKTDEEKRNLLLLESNTAPKGHVTNP